MLVYALEFLDRYGHIYAYKLFDKLPEIEMIEASISNQDDKDGAVEALISGDTFVSPEDGSSIRISVRSVTNV